MCGRYATTRTSSDLDDAFAARLADGAELPPPDWNVAPTKQAPVVVGRARDDAEESAPPRRELLAATWGLVPSWAKDRSIGSRMINARSETVAEKPSFRRAFARRRAIVPADGYYEWYAGQGPKAPKQPFYITSGEQDGRREVLGLAGLYEFWRSSAEEPWLVTFTILTTSAEGGDGMLHDRAPLLVAPEVRDLWLSPVERPAAELLDLLVPATPGRLDAWPVTTQVNNVRNNGPELVEPLPAE
ncbi:SOS response-associated peptidase [Cytobacillus oceanisediminis]